MNKKMFGGWLVAAVSYLTGFAQASPAPADEEAVVQTVRQMYLALTHDDIAELRAVTAPDFYVFDLGEKMTGAELMTVIKSAHAAGKTIVWNVTEPTVRFEGAVAWITYVNRGYVQDTAGKKDVSWLESAVLLKERGTWRIQFFHSTRVPAK